MRRLSGWVLAGVGLLGGSAAAYPVEAQDTLVVVAGTPAWGSDVGLVEEVRIGAVEGSPEYTFGRVVGVVQLSDGSVVVADGQGPSLKRYSSAGRYVDTWGRSGQGPGEYDQILGVAAHPDGGVAIWDPANARVSIYDGEGTFTRSLRVTSGWFSADVFQVDTSGVSYVQTLVGERRSAIGHDPTTAWLKVSPEGEILDTVPVPSRGTRGARFTKRTPSGQMAPFTFVTYSAMSPHGYLVTGRNTSYAVTRPLADGRILRMEGSARRVPVGDREKEEWEATGESLSRTVPTRGIDVSTVPNRKPFFRALHVDRDGRIWVWRYVRAVQVDDAGEEGGEGPPRLTWREPPTWDVFDPRGQFLGTVVLPREGRLVHATGDTLWTVEEGVFGENYVVRYRIERGGG